MEIAGKKVIITGGARGMGRRFALDFQRLGAKCFVIDVIQENLDELANTSGIPGRVVDVSDEGQVVDFFEGYANENGAPDVLVNNAGITADSLFIKKKKDGEIVKLSYADWQKVLNVNLSGVFLCGREAAYQMVKHGLGGVIVNISSISRSGNVGQSNYSASKSAIDALTVTWAKELAKYGIRVGAVAPGYINTEMVAKIRPEMLERIVQNIPLGRLGEMDEISRAVRFIVEDDFFSGRVLEVDGCMRI